MMLFSSVPDSVLIELSSVPGAVLIELCRIEIYDCV